MWKKLNSRVVFDTDEVKGVPSTEDEPLVVDDDQMSELDDLLGDDTAGDVMVEESGDGESVDPEPVAEPIVDDEPVVEPVAEGPVVEPVVEPEPVDRLAELEAANQRLLEAVEKLSGGSVADPTQVSLPPEVEGETIDLVEMFKDADLTEVMDSKEGFLGFLGKILKAQDSLTRKQIFEKIPTTVTPLINTYSSQQMLIKDFYDNNKHLSKIKSYVGKVASEVANREENKDKTLGEILDLTASEVNEVIGFKGVETSKGAQGGRSKEPVLPGATGGVRTKPAPSNTLQDEIADLVMD